jgi:P pilus assembly chaperone PapD
VDFGVVDPKALSTKQVSVTVTNTGQTSAQIRVRGAPRWLLIKPQTFRLMPGAKQVVKLIGRVDKVRGRRQKVTLTFAVDGGPDQEIDIRLEVKRQGLFG